MPGTVADQVSLGYHQIHAYAMRNFLDMPKELQGGSLRAIPKKEADKAALRKLAELAQRLGFEFPEITTLKEYPHSTPPAATHTLSKPVLVISGRGEIKSQRCGLPYFKPRLSRQFTFWRISQHQLAYPAQLDLPNNTRLTLLRDSSQTQLGTNIQAIPTFNSIHLHLFLDGFYSASPPLSCVEIPLKRADYVSHRGPHSATSHRRSLNTS